MNEKQSFLPTLNRPPPIRMQSEQKRASTHLIPWGWSEEHATVEARVAGASVEWSDRRTRITGLLRSFWPLPDPVPPAGASAAVAVEEPLSARLGQTLQLDEMWGHTWWSHAREASMRVDWTRPHLPRARRAAFDARWGSSPMVDPALTRYAFGRVVLDELWQEEEARPNRFDLCVATEPTVAARPRQMATDPNDWREQDRLDRAHDADLRHRRERRKDIGQRWKELCGAFPGLTIEAYRPWFEEQAGRRPSQTELERNAMCMDSEWWATVLEDSVWIARGGRPRAVGARDSVLGPAAPATGRPLRRLDAILSSRSVLDAVAVVLCEWWGFETPLDAAAHVRRWAPPWLPEPWVAALSARLSDQQWPSPRIVLFHAAVPPPSLMATPIVELDAGVNQGEPPPQSDNQQERMQRWWRQNPRLARRWSDAGLLPWLRVTWETKDGQAEPWWAVVPAAPAASVREPHLVLSSIAHRMTVTLSSPETLFDAAASSHPASSTAAPAPHGSIRKPSTRVGQTDPVHLTSECLLESPWKTLDARTLRVLAPNDSVGGGTGSRSGVEKTPEPDPLRRKQPERPSDVRPRTGTSQPSLPALLLCSPPDALFSALGLSRAPVSQ